MRPEDGWNVLPVLLAARGVNGFSALFFELKFQVN